MKGLSYVDVVRELVKSGADINAKEKRYGNQRFLQRLVILRIENFTK